MPPRWARWVDAAVRDEELEGLAQPTRGRSPDWAVAGAALAVVAAAVDEAVPVADVEQAVRGYSSIFAAVLSGDEMLAV